MRRVWIIGPVAIDRVLYLESLPTEGTFTRPLRISERIGGSSGNVALALADTGVETGFISYIGDDAGGKKIIKRFSESKVKNLYLQKIEGETNSALVMVDQSGDRTIVALTESHLAEVTIAGIDFRANDIVVFSLWRPCFAAHLAAVQKLGCITVVGLEALKDFEITGADFAIGSEAELGGEDPENHLGRFPTIVATRGAAGIDQFQSGQHIHQPALPGKVIDTTGAGDSFLAGYLSQLAHDIHDLRSALHFGTRWAAQSIAVEGSAPTPPPL